MLGTVYDAPLFLDMHCEMVDDYDFQELWEEKHRQAFEEYRACLYAHGYLDFSLLILEAMEQIKRIPS